MRITLHTDYSLRTLLFLGLHPERVVPIGVIADAYGISRDHAAKVAKNLVRLGYVQSRRGQAGGLRLAREPEAIGIGAVIRDCEGFDVLECFDPKTNTCPISRSCRLEGIFEEAVAAFLAVADRYSLADVLKDRGQLARLLPVLPPPPGAERGAPRRARARG